MQVLTSTSARLLASASVDSRRSCARVRGPSPAQASQRISPPQASASAQSSSRQEQWQLSAAALSLSVALILAPADAARAGLFGGGKPKADPRLSAYESVLKSTPSPSSDSASSSSPASGYKLPDSSIRCPPGFEISFPKSTAIVQCIQINASGDASTALPEGEDGVVKAEKKSSSPSLGRADALREAMKAEDALDALESSNFQGITIEELKD